MTLIKQPMYQKDLAKVINHTPKIKSKPFQMLFIAFPASSAKGLDFI